MIVPFMNEGSGIFNPVRTFLSRGPRNLPLPPVRCCSNRRADLWLTCSVMGMPLPAMEARAEIGMPDPELPTSGEVDTAKTVCLTEKDVRDAARLFRLISDGTPWANLLFSDNEVARRASAEPISPDELIARARAVLQTRRLRARHFNRVMFAEPAWDMLLLLYLADSSEGRQTIGQLAELVETPLTTVLRWVGYLEKEHLIERKEHPTDRRIVFIKLMDKGRAAMDAFLTDMPE